MNIEGRVFRSAIDIFMESRPLSQVPMNMPAPSRFGSRPLIGEMYQPFGVSYSPEWIDFTNNTMDLLRTTPAMPLRMSSMKNAIQRISNSHCDVLIS